MPHSTHWLCPQVFYCETVASHLRELEDNAINEFAHMRCEIDALKRQQQMQQLPQHLLPAPVESGLLKAPSIRGAPGHTLRHRHAPSDITEDSYPHPLHGRREPRDDAYSIDPLEDASLCSSTDGYYVTRKARVDSQIERPTELMERAVQDLRETFAGDVLRLQTVLAEEFAGHSEAVATRVQQAMAPQLDALRAQVDQERLAREAAVSQLGTDVSHLQHAIQTVNTAMGQMSSTVLGVGEQVPICPDLRFAEVWNGEVLERRTALF